MVQIDVRIAQRMDELPRLETALARHHHRQQRIRGYVEGYAEKRIGTALVELAREAPARNIELEQDVAWRQGHLLNLRDIPCRDYYAARVGIMLYKLRRRAYLVNISAVGTRPAAPLIAVYMVQVAIVIPLDG